MLSFFSLLFFCNHLCVCLLLTQSMSDSLQPHRVAHQAPLSMEFSRTFPSPEDLPDPGIESGTPALQADSLPSESLGKHVIIYRWVLLFILS